MAGFDSKIDQLYHKLVDGFMQDMKSDDFYGYFINAIKSGENTVSLNERFVERNIDLRWVESIENAIIPLDNIIRNPQRFIKNLEEVAPIEQVRTVTTEGIRHLAQHTNFIARVEGEEVTPEKMLNVIKEESFDTYENRFIYTLLNKLEYFLDKRLDALMTGKGVADRFELKMDGDFVAGIDTLRYGLSLQFDSPHRDLSDMDLMVNADTSQLNAMQRIERIRKILYNFESSQFIRDMAGCALVRPPLKMTNVLTKNQNFRKAVDLWIFVESYDEVGYNVQHIERTVEPDEDYLTAMFGTIAFQYLIMKKNSGNIIDIADYAERRKENDVKFIRNSVDEFIDSFDLEVDEIRRIFVERVNNRKRKQRVQYKIAKDIVSRAVSLDKERIAAQERHLQELARRAEERRRLAEERRAAVRAEKIRLAQERVRLRAENKERRMREAAEERARRAEERAAERLRRAEEKARLRAIEKERRAEERRLQREEARLEKERIKAAEEAARREAEERERKHQELLARRRAAYARKKQLAAAAAALAESLAHPPAASETEPMSEVEPEIVPEPVPMSETVAAEPVPMSEVEAAPEPVPMSETVAAEPAPEPISESVPAPAVEPVSEEPESEPVFEEPESEVVREVVPEPEAASEECVLRLPEEEAKPVFIETRLSLWERIKRLFSRRDVEKKHSAERAKVEKAERKADDDLSKSLHDLKRELAAGSISDAQVEKIADALEIGDGELDELAALPQLAGDKEAQAALRDLSDKVRRLRSKYPHKEKHVYDPSRKKQRNRKRLAKKKARESAEQDEE